MSIDPLELGTITATPAALDVIANAATARGESADRLCQQLLAKHASHDWGDIDADDRRANTRALIEGSRVMSTYPIGGQCVWVITDAEDDQGRRASTTVLLPADY